MEKKKNYYRVRNYAESEFSARSACELRVSTFGALNGGAHNRNHWTYSRKRKKKKKITETPLRAQELGHSKRMARQSERVRKTLEENNKKGRNFYSAQKTRISAVFIDEDSRSRRREGLREGRRGRAKGGGELCRIEKSLQPLGSCDVRLTAFSLSPFLSFYLCYD